MPSAWEGDRPNDRHKEREHRIHLRAAAAAKKETLLEIASRPSKRYIGYLPRISHLYLCQKTMPNKTKRRHPLAQVLRLQAQQFLALNRQLPNPSRSMFPCSALSGRWQTMT